MFEDKIAIVTGANSGMGKATVKQLCDMGMKVIMVCRSQERGMKAYEEIMEVEGRKVELMFCDLADFTSIRKFSEKFHEKYEKLDIIINNAGFISLDRRETKDGLEYQMGVNHFGHFLLTILLLDQMKEGARIINVASGAHKSGKIHFDDIHLKEKYNVVKAYSQSKLANVLFTRELGKRLEAYGITVNCCHPGAVATSMGVDRETGFGKKITGLLKPFFVTPEKGCETAVFLATDLSVTKKSGGYYYKCRLAPSSLLSKDMELAEKLFVFSEETTKAKLSEQLEKMVVSESIHQL